jgi:hypothetical protein
MITKCMGKLPAVADSRRLQFSAYTAAVLPPTPPTSDRTYGITDWTPMGNIGEHPCGDCAYASAGHMEMAWSMGTTKKPVIIPEDVIVGDYATGTGYNPATGAGDNGSVLLNVLEQWRTTGIGGNKNAAYGGLDLSDPEHVRQAIHFWGGAYVGVMLPKSAEEQFDRNLTWTTPWFSPIVGGHAFPLLSYSATHLWCITWAKIQAMTWDFFFRYCDEAFAVVDPLWIGADGNAPSLLNLDALVSRLIMVNQPNTPPPLPSRLVA